MKTDITMSSGPKEVLINMSDIITIKDFAHPMDRVLTKQILEFPGIKQLLDFAHEQKIDEVNTFLYNSSCIRLPDDHPAVYAFREGKRRFNVRAEDNVYVVRDYNFDVKVIGYSNPIVLISSRLIEENSSFLLNERVAVAAAAIACEHHKLDFLLWVYDNFKSLISVPIISTGLTVVINEWMRSREYTMDRAFYIYTNDLTLAKKNIFYGYIPYSIIRNFDFSQNETFLKQVDEFNRKENVVDFALIGLSSLQKEIWIPARYEELCKFSKEGRI